ncbi:MAG: hypothetical protein AAF557_21945 [Pseudomonadota bacterium]
MTKTADGIMKESVETFSGSPDALVARYGGDLECEGLTHEQQAQILTALWQIMTAFVDLGFSVKAGDKFTPTAEIGMDDVLKSLIPEETAPETAAPKNNNSNEKESQS